MTQKNILYALIFIFLNPMLVLAQKSWSLDECINYAIENNLSIKDFKYSEDSGQETKRQAYRNLFPRISGNVGYSIQYGRSVDPNNNTFVSTDFFSNNYSINASVDIFNGWQKLNTIASAKFIHKALSEETLQEKYMLAFRVMEYYYNVLYFKKAVEIFKAQEQISKTNFTFVKRQKEMGIKAGADVYTAESAFMTDKLKLTQAINNLQLAKLQLAQEMNLENPLQIQINEIPTLGRKEKQNDSIHSVKHIYNKATLFIPSIKASKARVASAKKELAISRGALAPMLSFSLGYGTGYYETNVDDTGKIISFNKQLKDNASTSVGVNLRIPIFQAWSRRSNIKQKKIALLQAENSFELEKQELRKIIEQLIQDYRSSISEYEQTQQQEKARELSFKIAQKKYSNGLINAIDLNTEKNLYATAQNENLQVELKLKVQEQTLLFYRGIQVFNIKKTNKR